jgi:hypothetical protein
MLDPDPDPDEMNADPQPCLEESLQICLEDLETWNLTSEI